MSKKGYAFESHLEDFFLSFTGQTKHDPILKTTSAGVIQINRSFRVPASGAMDALAGDVITYLPWLQQQFKVEAKERYEKTKMDGYVLNVEIEWINKNNEEAITDKQIPILAIKFKRRSRNQVWWIMKKVDLTKLIEPINNQVALDIGSVKVRVNKTRIKLIHKELSDINMITEFSLNDEDYLLIPHHVFNDVMERLKNV
ncbi:MAG: hypothetical protein V3U54_08935 [Thermodesulfobacteriota bacterium]